MTIADIFEKAGIEGVKDKRYRIFCELGFVRKSRQLPFTKANIFKAS